MTFPGHVRVIGTREQRGRRSAISAADGCAALWRMDPPRSDRSNRDVTTALRGSVTDSEPATSRRFYFLHSKLSGSSRTAALMVTFPLSDSNHYLAPSIGQTQAAWFLSCCRQDSGRKQNENTYF